VESRKINKSFQSKGPKIVDKKKKKKKKKKQKQEQTLKEYEEKRFQ